MADNYTAVGCNPFGYDCLLIPFVGTCRSMLKRVAHFDSEADRMLAHVSPLTA